MAAKEASFSDAGDEFDEDELVDNRRQNVYGSTIEEESSGIPVLDMMSAASGGAIRRREVEPQVRILTQLDKLTSDK